MAATATAHSPSGDKGGPHRREALKLDYYGHLRYWGKERYYLEQNFDMASLAITDLQPETV